MKTREINFVYYGQLTHDTDLSEMCEMHSRGFVVEIVLHNITKFHSDALGIGQNPLYVISATTFAERDDCHNLSDIGSGERWKSAVDVKYFITDDQTQAFAKATLLMWDEASSINSI